MPRMIKLVVYAFSVAMGISMAGLCVHAHSVDTTPRQTLVLQSGNEFLALESWDRIGLFNMTSGALLRRFHIATEYIRAYEVSADGNILAVIGKGGLWILDFRTGVEISHVPVETHLYGVSMSADGSIVGTAGYRGGVQVYQSRTGKLIARIGNVDEIALDVALHPDGKSGAIVGIAEKVSLFLLPSGELTGTVLDGAPPLCYGSDGKRLAMRSNNSGSDESLRMVDTNSFNVQDLGRFETISNLRATEDGFVFVTHAKDSQGIVEGQFLSNTASTYESVWTNDHSLGGADFLPTGTRAVRTSWTMETTVFDFKIGTAVFSKHGTHGTIDQVNVATRVYVIVGIGVVLLLLVVAARRFRGRIWIQSCRSGH